MIIVLGMDNTGKSTLTKKLAEILKGEVVNSMGPGTQAQQRDWVVSQVNRNLEPNSNYVHDRFTCFEEMIYGKVLRGGVSNFTLQDDPYVNLLKSIKPIIVYARPDNNTIFNFGDREQMEGVIDNSQKLLEAYDELIREMRSLGWTILQYDYTKQDPYTLVEDIKLIYRTRLLSLIF